MCGRTALFLSGKSTDDICQRSGARRWTDSELYRPSYNVAPTRYQPVMIRGHSLQSMRWGLIPRWSSSPSSSLKTINARNDAILSGKSPLWKSVRHQRCIVLAQGYYEWNAKDTTPYYIERRKELPKDNHDFLDPTFVWFAGLYECTTKGSTKSWSYTIITTSAASDLSFLHHRMPVIFTQKSQVEDWLSDKPFEKVESLLKPLENGFTLTPVSKFVNTVGNDSPICIQPVALQKSVKSFFHPVKDGDGMVEKKRWLDELGKDHDNKHGSKKIKTEAHSTTKRSLSTSTKSPPKKTPLKKHEESASITSYFKPFRQ